MPPAPLPDTPKASERAIALVFVLAILVLLSGLTIAFFSRAALHRQMTAASTAHAQAAILAQSAVEQITGDLLAEIESGSDPDPFPAAHPAATAALRNPTMVAVPGVTGLAAPSMVPQRVASNGIQNILKRSHRAEPFFSGTLAGYQGSVTVPARASAIATSDAAPGGRSIVASRWNKPQLMTAAEMTAFTPPDWVYVNRKGENPTSFSPADLKTLGSRQRGNESYVVGRYACVVYDEGGLIDINAAGNGLDAAANARRGRLHQVPLSAGIGGVAFPNASEFIDWRWPVSKADAAEDGAGLFAPQRTFIEVETGEQALVSRQDLIRYATRSGSPIPPEALPYLTPFSRDVDAPAYVPDPNRPKLPASPSPDEVNPAVAAVRFPADTVLKRPEGNVTVAGGTSVMPRRFPLAKLRLFEDAEPDAAAMLYYFGLEKEGSGKWKYVQTNKDGIAHLSDVATAGREPNFFEVLQAAIYTGSLGKSGGDGPTLDDARDSRRDLEVMQIGANIIDQWDRDDLPTTIVYPWADPADPLVVYGIENLPYIQQMMFTPIRPAYDPDNLQVWLMFDVWNPHQNAAVPPQGIQAFRIRPVGGTGRIDTSYTLRLQGQSSDNSAVKQTVSSSTQSIAGLNQDIPLIFSVSGTYSEPTTIGDGNPTDAAKIPGILLGQVRRSAAIPPPDDRTPALQIALNDVHDTASPYSTTPPATPVINASGRREYPPGTTIDLGPIGANHWAVLSSGTASSVVVYAKHGVKAANLIQFRASTTDPVDLELQWLPTGSNASDESAWAPYQRIEGLFNDGTETITHSREYYTARAFGDTGADANTALLEDTHHSARPVADIPRNFYQWRTQLIKDETGVRTYVRSDPRTARFGFGVLDTDWLGRNFRSTSLPWNGADKKTDVRWLQFKTVYPGKAAASGFELWKAGLYPPFGAVANDPTVPLSGSQPVRYADVDGIVRPGDGYFGSDPVIAIANGGKNEDRPVILNRAFRSVGELGYAFRDVPWKTLDFSTRFSADLGLADLFTLDEPGKTPALVAGKVNLNTASKPVLELLLKGASKQEGNAAGSVSSRTLSDQEASDIAAAIVAEAKKAPFRNRGDLVSRVLNSGTSSPLDGTVVKAQREASVRALAEMTTTRTWTLLIDVIAQTGRVPPSAASAADFAVKSECRRWVHLVIDRMTGEIVEIKTENVYE